MRGVGSALDGLRRRVVKQVAELADVLDQPVAFLDETVDLLADRVAVARGLLADLVGLLSGARGLGLLADVHQRPLDDGVRGPVRLELDDDLRYVLHEAVDGAAVVAAAYNGEVDAGDLGQEARLARAVAARSSWRLRPRRLRLRRFRRWRF